MSMKDLNITIPAEIAVLPLNLSEKVVLAQIHLFPGSSNRRLAELVGGTCRGVENLLYRLRQQNHITGNGRARRHRLMFLVRPHSSCGNTDHVKSHTSGGDQEAELQASSLRVLTRDCPAAASRLDLVSLRRCCTRSDHIRAGHNIVGLMRTFLR